MYIYIAKHSKVGSIGGIIQARDSVEAYSIASKEVVKRGGSVRALLFTSL